MIPNFTNWTTKQTILIILAHPDDPEYFLGGTIALWTSQGHEVNYWLLTHGEKGCDSYTYDCERISEIRSNEQIEAARVLGVTSVHFAEFLDGELLPCEKIRKEVVRAIRTARPNILVTCDPFTRSHRNNALNHPDHVYTGVNVLDALYPAANNALYFPELLAEGLQPHNVSELWLSLTNRRNYRVNVTNVIETKINSILKHKSQVRNNSDHIRNRIMSDYCVKLFSKNYYEYFYRVKLK